VDGELGGARQRRRSGIDAEAEDSGESAVEGQQLCSALAARRASGSRRFCRQGARSVVGPGEGDSARPGSASCGGLL
jgi:hypothetical protein